MFKCAIIFIFLCHYSYLFKHGKICFNDSVFDYFFVKPKRIFSVNNKRDFKKNILL